MHSYINFSKLASLYVCFSMLHTTLHNGTDIIQRKYQSHHHIGRVSNIRNETEEHNFNPDDNAIEFRHNSKEGERKVFDMIIPKHDEELLLWPKTGKYVVIPYALDTSLSPDQQRAIPGILHSIESRTCLRFTAESGPCGGGGPKLCFRAGPERAAHWGRRPGGPQPVTLEAGDGPYWVLHLVGHVLGLPHPEMCLEGPASGQKRRWNETRNGCIPRLCPCRRFDSSSALRLAPGELHTWLSPPLNTPAALLALLRTRRAARLSHWDRRALDNLYRCWEGQPSCPGRRCRHGGFRDDRCRCVCPPGFTGEDCGVKSGRGEEVDEGCVKQVTVGQELKLRPSELIETLAALDQCTLRVRTSAQMLRISISFAGMEKQREIIYSEALLCTVRMYVFPGGAPVKMFCMLDFLGESLVVSVPNNTVDFLFSSDSALAHTQKAIVEPARVAVRSAYDPTNTTDTATSAAAPNTTGSPASVASAAPMGKNQTASAEEHDHGLELIILTPVLFALMGINVLVVFCIRKYWEYRYGTAGIYRGTERDYWTEEDEEEPEDWQIKVEYSDSEEDASAPARESLREPSLPHADMTDLELFRYKYGIAGYQPPDDIEERSTESVQAESSSSDERQESAGGLTLTGTSSKTKKRVSFSDESGLPLHVHSDETTGKQKQKDDRERKAQTLSQIAKRSQPKPETEEVRITVPFSDIARSAQSTDDSNGSDTDDSSEESSCCQSSSSSSCHEDEEEAKKAEPGLLHGLTRCFRRKPENETNEI